MSLFDFSCLALGISWIKPVPSCLSGQHALYLLVCVGVCLWDFSSLLIKHLLSVKLCVCLSV